MTRKSLTLLFLLAVSATCAFAQQPAEEITKADASVPAATDSASLNRPVLIVREFTVSNKTGWPYDLKQLQSETVAELRGKTSTTDVLVGPPATPRAHTYTLEGEIVSWRSGNAAKRYMIG